MYGWQIYAHLNLTVVMVTMAHQYASKMVLKLVLGSSFLKTKASEANVIESEKQGRKGDAGGK